MDIMRILGVDFKAFLDIPPKIQALPEQSEKIVCQSRMDTELTMKHMRDMTKKRRLIGNLFTCSQISPSDLSDLSDSSGLSGLSSL